MSIDAPAYRHLETRPAGHLRAVVAIARFSLKLVFRQKLFWVVVALAMLHFLFHFALIYIKAQIEVQRPGMQRFLDQYLVTGDGEAYRDFLFGQSLAVMILTAFIANILVTNDYRAGGLAFFLAKPIGKPHYVAGKLLALATLVGMITLAPAAALFIEYAVFTASWDYIADNLEIAVGIVGYSLLLMTIPSLLLLALGALLRRTVPLLAVWSAIFVVMPAASELLRTIFEDRQWRLLSLWRSLRIVGDRCFGAVRFPSEGNQLEWAIASLVAASVTSLLVLHWKLKPVEVVG